MIPALKGSVKITGTTCATADSPAVRIPRKPPQFKGMNIETICNGEGVYIEGADNQRDGITAALAEQTIDAGQYTWGAGAFLTKDLYVFCYDDVGDSSNGKCATVYRNGSTWTVGTPVAFNAAATDGIDVKRLSDTTFVVAYGDNGGDDYLCARIGTVTAGVPAFGTEKALTSAAIDIADGGVAVAEPRPGVLAFAYQLAGDSKGYVLAATYSGTTIATPGTAVEFEAGETIYISMDKAYLGAVIVAYQDDDNSDYLTTNVGTVSAAGVVAFGGSSETHTTAAATSIEVHYMAEGKVIVSWIDTGDYHVLAATVATTVVTEGADYTAAGTVLTASTSPLDDTHFIIAMEDDAHAGDYGTWWRCTVDWSDSSIEADSVADYFAAASTQTVKVIANNNNEALVVFDDAGDSNATKAVNGIWCDDLIDVRSAAASATYSVRVLPVLGEDTTITIS
jgi:hypothetical protein